MENIQQILETLGYRLKNRGREWSCRPLYRDSDNDSALSINKDTGEFYDFVEARGGDFHTLVEKTLGRPLDPDLKEKIYSHNFLPKRKEEIEIPTQKTFDKSLLLNLINDNSYWNNRGISNQTLAKFQGGLSINGKMRNRYVFPIFNLRHELVGFSGRYIYNSEYVSKWKHLGTKNEWIYPTIHIPEINTKREIILLESHGDCLALHENGIKNTLVSFGVKLSPALIKFLLQIQPKRVLIALNNDSEKNNVGNKAAEEFKNTLRNFFDIKQIQIALPSKKDFGEMTPEEIIEWRNQFNV
jgi:DNA primase